MSIKIAILIAHPDDEVLFFLPTIHYWTQQQNAQITLICMTHGNDHRGQELRQSAKHLSIHQVVALDLPSFPDCMSIRWNVIHLADLLSSLLTSLKPNHLYSFDLDGISGHLNHVALAEAIPLISIKTDCSSTDDDKTLAVMQKYRLKSKSWIGKYILPVIPLFHPSSTRSSESITNVASDVHQKTGSHPLALFPSVNCLQKDNTVQYVMGTGNFSFSGHQSFLKQRLFCRQQAWKGMQIHASQNVWYRWLYIWTSSYILSNEYELIH